MIKSAAHPSFLKTSFIESAKMKIITDDWITRAIKNYTDAHNALAQMGPVFESTRKEIGRMLMTLEDMQRARKEK